MNLHSSLAVVGIVLILGSLSLVLMLSSQSSVGLAQFSIERCSLPNGFEQSFDSKDDCQLALLDLCSTECPSNVRDCVFISKRECQDIGRTFVRTFR